MADPVNHLKSSSSSASVPNYEIAKTFFNGYSNIETQIKQLDNFIVETVKAGGNISSNTALSTFLANLRLASSVFSEPGVLQTFIPHVGSDASNFLGSLYSTLSKTPTQSVSLKNLIQFDAQLKAFALLYKNVTLNLTDLQNCMVSY